MAQSEPATAVESAAVTPGHFFERVWDGAEASCREVAAPVADVFRLGGRRTRLRSASATLHAALASALRRWPGAGPTENELDIVAWETAAGAVPFPVVPGAGSDPWRHGRVERFCDERHVLLWQPQLCAVTAVDCATGRAVFVIDAAGRLPYHERAAPLKPLLNVYFGASRRGHLIHGAAVARHGRGLLLTAPGGSGKSTTALSALRAGWDYLADDWCLVSQDGAPRLHSVYETAKLHWDNLHRAAGFESVVINRAAAATEKAVLALGASAWGGGFREEVPLHAIALPHVASGADTTFARVNGLRAFHGMATETLRSITGTGPASVEWLARLSRSVPVYSLALGSDLERIPPALEQLLAAAEGAR